MDPEVESVLEDVTLVYLEIAKNVVMYLDDEGEDGAQARQLDRLRRLMMDHAKLIIDTSNKDEALKGINEKLINVEDLEVDKEYKSILSELTARHSVGQRQGHKVFERLERAIAKATEERNQKRQPAPKSS